MSAKDLMIKNYVNIELCTNRPGVVAVATVMQDPHGVVEEDILSYAVTIAIAHELIKGKTARVKYYTQCIEAAKELGLYAYQYAYAAEGKYRSMSQRNGYQRIKEYCHEQLDKISSNK